MSYASFTWSVPGTPATARALRDRLNQLALNLFRAKQRRGRTASTCYGATALVALAEGRAALMPIPSPHDRAWLAEQLLSLSAAHPDRAACLEAAINGLRAADELSELPRLL